MGPLWVNDSWKMINLFLKFKMHKNISSQVRKQDIVESKKILFSIFTRYGDTVIDLLVIKEFIDKFPEKKYLVLCPRQMQPYVNELLPDIEYIALNKRNLFDMFKINRKLKKWQPDIGFNPWSSGLDSCYFLTYCKKYFCYKDFNRPKIINHYQVVRRYFILPERDWKIDKLILKKDYQKILICPQSTDQDRGISSIQLDKLIFDLNIKYHNPKITIASMDKSNFRNDYNQFLFKKTVKSSRDFISLVKDSELVICSDSGPLHIASALNKDLIAIFKSTNPEIVVKSESKLKIKKMSL